MFPKFTQTGILDCKRQFCAAKNDKFCFMKTEVNAAVTGKWPVLQTRPSQYQWLYGSFQIYLFPSAGTWTSFSGKLKQCYKNLCFTFPICETLFFGVNQQFKQTK